MTVNVFHTYKRKSKFMTINVFHIFKFERTSN